MTTYHVTPTRNLGRIQKQGLVPQTGARAALMEQEDGIYLFNSLASVDNALSNWLGDEFGENVKLALLEVTVPPGAKTIPTTAEYETVIATPIPPQYIKVLYRDIDTDEAVKALWNANKDV